MGNGAEQRAARPPLVLWVALLVVGAYGPFVFALQDLTHLQGWYLPHAGTYWGRDFTNLYFGGRLGWDGLDVYQLGDYQAALHQLGIEAGQNYSYPPATLFVGKALSLLPYPAAFLLWAVAGLACFIVAARPYIRFAWPWLLLVPAAAAFPNGQYGLFLAALWLWAFRGSGAATGVLTLKPHCGLLLAPALFVRRKWCTIAVAVIVTLALWGLAEWCFGLTRSFFESGARVQLSVLATSRDEPYFAAMPSVFVRLRHWPIAAWTAQGVVALATLAMIWPLWRLPLKALAFPLATATFLILPYSFAYDMAVVSLGFAVLIHDRWGEMDWPERAAAAGGYMAVIVPMLAPPLLFAGLWAQRRAALREIVGARGVPLPDEDRQQPALPARRPQRPFARPNAG